MNKRMFFCAFVAGFFWCTAISAQDQVPAPSYKEGDTWRFNITRKGGIVSSTDLNDGTYELTFTQGNVKLFKVDGNEKNPLTIEADGPTQGLLTLIEKSEQRPSLKFPLSVGQKWTYQYRTRPAGSRQDQTNLAEINVAGAEEVSTPAGSFKTYKLIMTQSWTAGLRGKQGGSTTTYFYSPETRSIVKRSSENQGSGATVETELIKFTPGN